MGTWYNSDGLYIKYGTDRATLSVGGSYEDQVAGAMVIEATFNLATLGTSAAIIDDQIRFGKDWRIEKVEVVTVTAATSGGAATLNIGLQRSDRSTEHDYDGFVAALALASINVAGETNVLTAGTTGAGALVGTTLASTAAGTYLTADYDTAAFTAGRIKVRIFLSKVV